MGITSRLINSAEQRFGENLDYMRISRAHRRAPSTSLGCSWLAKHRKAAPADAYFLAVLGALPLEDCGPCVQIAVNEALAAGLAPEILSAAVTGGSKLTPEQKLYLDFGRAVSANAPEAEELRLEVAKMLSPTAMVDLAIAIAGCRVFPALKRGLGHATSCSLVTVTIGNAKHAPASAANTPVLRRAESVKSA